MNLNEAIAYCNQNGISLRRNPDLEDVKDAISRKVKGNVWIIGDRLYIKTSR